MLFEIEFPHAEQPQDAWQKLYESLDDTSIWQGHIEIRKIEEKKDSNGFTYEYVRESILAFRKKKQIEIILRDSKNNALKIVYGKGPLKGYQIFDFEYDKIIITGDIGLRGLLYPFTKFALKHIINGEINALNRLFNKDFNKDSSEQLEKFGKH
jgi:hypothetical protein